VYLADFKVKRRSVKMWPNTICGLSRFGNWIKVSGACGINSLCDFFNVLNELVTKLIAKKKIKSKTHTFQKCSRLAESFLKVANGYFRMLNRKYRDHGCISKGTYFVMVDLLDQL